MRKIGIYFIALFLVVSHVSCCKGNKKQQVISPDGKITAEIYTPDENNNVTYKVLMNGKEIIGTSALGISLQSDDQDFTKNLKLVSVDEAVINETYKMPIGKRSVCLNKANEKTFTMENKSGKKIKIVFRAYDDGIAFRYELTNEKQDVVLEEVSGFKVNPESNAWAQKYIFDYQGTYDKIKVKDLNLPAYNFPALIETPDSCWMLISDAAVFGNYASCELTHKGKGSLQIYLPNHQGIDVPVNETGRIIVEPNLKTPWRAVIMGSKLNSIVESTMIINLNPPCEIQDLSWIKPGVAAFPWWANFFANDSKEAMYKFVDMVAEMGWQYVEFDIGLMGYDGWRTSQNWKKVKHIPEVIEYAKQKGVLIYGWDERKATDTPEKREDIFGSYIKMGIAGIKLDYLNSDKQECMKYMEDAVRDAAKRKLLVSFHGCIAPKGMQRTFPNIMTYEGVAGGEYYKINPWWQSNPVHSTTLPFTRNIVGSMDFTPCSFSMSENVIRWDHDNKADVIASSTDKEQIKKMFEQLRKDDKYKRGSLNIYPQRQSSYAYELALPFVFESGWIAMADNPESYLNSPAKPLLKKLCSTWDDIHFIAGYPGEYICLARRKGNDWFIAAINAGNDKTIELNLDFIPDGEHTASFYTDGQNPLTDVKSEEMAVKKGDKKSLSLKHNGGFVLYIQGK